MDRDEELLSSLGGWAGLEIAGFERRERFAAADYSDVRVIGVDEFALHKGHRYATVVVEPSRRRVLWVGKGRDRRSFRRLHFAQRLKPYLHGILAHTRWPLHTSLIGGINNRIKVIKHTACGFRDDEYFFLKITAAFPVKREE